MPQFTQWNVPNPFPNILYNPAAVDAAIAHTQSELGNLDINRQKLGLEQRKLDLQQSAGEGLINSLGGGNTTGTPSADVTPFEQKMGVAEGGTDPTVVNKQGYAGQFQFGSERLADLGLYTPAPGEGKNGWKGKFHIAPYNVANLQDFLTNPAAQHAAFVAHVADIDKAIAATPGADKFDVNGLRAVAHLGGVGGMRSFIASGGNLNSQDANGTSLKNYYQRFASGGPTALQQAFGSVHGPGGPPSDTPAVLPGGNVSTAWVDPNAPLPVPPIPPAGGPPPAFNPNTGPRVAGASPAGAPGVVPVVAPGTLPPAAAVGTDDPNAKVSYPPVVTGQADEIAPAIAQTKTAMRLNGTDVAGPPGVVSTPPDAQPNRLAYGTDLPGVTIGLPTNGMASPPTAAVPVVTAATPPAPTSAAPTRPPVVAPPPAPSRAIPIEPVLPNGLTASQVRLAASMVQSGAPVADVAAHLEQWRQANRSGQQQQATQAALDAQAQFERQKYYVEQQQKAEQTAYSRNQDAIKNQREEAAAARAGLPEGYRLDDKGNATRINGLPPDPKVAQAAKDAYDAEQRKNPVRGEGLEAQHENTVLQLYSSILDGTATPAQRALYALHYGAMKQGTPEWVDDPTKPGTKMLVRVPREIPSMFPSPDYKPGDPPSAGPGSAGAVQPIPGASKQDPLTEAQSKAGGYADRLQQALPVIEDTSPAAMSRWQMLLGKAPILGNTFVSPEFQLHQQSERNFINAILRQESGASIQPEEFASARLQYIPQPGDSSQVLAEKKRNREAKLSELIREAGPGYKPATASPASTPPKAERPPLSSFAR
jgi:hypothetical protein